MNKFRLLCAAAAIAAPTAAYAQETTGTIRGSVTNNGAAVANAEVVVENPNTGQRSTATTNEEGAFVFTGLGLGGPYRVTVTGARAAPNVIDDIFLSAGDPFRLPIDIGAPAPAEGAAIVVTGQRIGGQSLSPTTTLRRDDIEGVASVTRDVRDLIRRSPFAQLDTASPARAYSIAGQNPRFNRFSVNGVQFSDDFGLNAGGLPTSRGPVPLDAICQFSVEVAPVDIREGDFQGGAVNAQLCAGTNTPTGGAFYSYSDDSLSGDTADGRPVVLDFESKAYGAFLRGPIIRDRLFFAFAWERTREGEPALFGPVGSGLGAEVPGVTQARIDEIRGLTRSLYGYDPGGTVTTVPERDDRVTARFDWNINDDHSLQAIYIYNNGSQAIESGVGSPFQNSSSATTPRLALFSSSYEITEQVHSGQLQLNSRWSDMFSTEARVSYRDYNRGQTPPLGRDFGQFSVCLDPVTAGSLTGCTNGSPTITFGPDISRQSNDLNTENLDVQLTASLLVGSHNIRFLAQYNHIDVYNLFLQRTAGLFYFDSLDQFRRGEANTLELAQSTTGDIIGAAAVYNYQNYTLGVQDTWDVTDNLTVVAGVRYEWYDMGSTPVFNQFFTNRYGFSNQETLNGRDIILPRFGISWRPTERLQLRGSFGRYAAGTPDVYISNSFSNTGITQNRVNFNRTPTPAGCSGAAGTAAEQQAICRSALNNVFGAGPGIPQNVLNFVRNDQRSLALAPVNAIDPSFEIPNQWRAAGTVSYNADLGALGDDWFFAFDALYGWVDAAIDYVDLRSVQIGTAPDGRPRYGAFPGIGTNLNSDILLTNADEGESLILVGRFAKDFDNGFSIGASYTYQDITERSPLTSSVAFSNYQFQNTANPNGSSLGTSYEEIDHSVKLNLGFRREFFEGAETRIQLFGEWRRGRSYGLTFDANPGGGRDPVFGVLGSDVRHLIYVPAGADDPLVEYDSAATRDALNAFIEGSGLADSRGQIAPKNSERPNDVYRLDLHISQDIPLPSRLGRVQLFADMENVLNFINDEWGVIRQVSNQQAPILDVACVAVGANSCARYRYSNFRTPNENLITGASVWQLRVGARYEF